MLYDTPLIFKIAIRKDFFFPIVILFVLSIVSALLSPQPVLLTIFAVVLFGAGRYVPLLDTTKVNDIYTKLIIFPDARVIVSNHMSKKAGILCGQQWCTHRLAFLRYTISGKKQSLILLSVQQNCGDFRRLKVWLRQDYCSHVSKSSIN
jgi:hypothetical protein